MTSLLAAAGRGVLSGLALLGRYGTQAFAISLFVGLALPWLAAAARPLLAVAIFVFLLTTFVRVEVSALRSVARRPGLFGLACLCTVLVPPLVVSGAVALVGRQEIDPGLLLGLAVLAAAPPIMSSPAIAMLLGIEPALIIATVLVVTGLSPILSPLIAGLVAGAAVPMDVPSLVARLVGLVGGALLTALVLRRFVSREAIGRNRQSLDGIGVFMYFVFAIAAMDGVLPAVLNEPLRVAGYLAAAFSISLAGYAVSWPLLRAVPPAERLVLGYATGQRNMGLLIAALGASTPKTTFLFFALAQFPIYIGPQIIRIVTRNSSIFHEGQSR